MQSKISLFQLTKIYVKTCTTKSRPFHFYPKNELFSTKSQNLAGKYIRDVMLNM